MNSLARESDLDREEREEIARADAELARLKQDYLKWVEGDLERMSLLLDRVRKSAGKDAEALKALFNAMHTIKGQGATFGYAFVTDLADIACTVVREREVSTPAEIKAVDQCRAVIKVAIERRMEGDGGMKGREVLARLRAMAGDAIARRSFG